DVEVDVVTKPENFGFFAGCDRVRIHSGISEAELIRIYRKSDALLLPLADATANNSILEAMACGTPVITSDVGGIRGYVGEDAGWLFRKGDVGNIVKLIRDICADRQIAARKREPARRQALRFDWSQIHSQLTAVYEAAIARRKSEKTSSAR